MTEYHSSGFGETLRRRREQLGLSLNDVAVRTRVRKAYLQALEEENLAALPGSAYAIGFLRIYARQLDLAVDPLVNALTGRNDSGGDHRAPTSLEGNTAVPRGARRRGKGWRLLSLLLLLVLTGGAYLFYLQGHPVPPVPVKTTPPPAEVPAAPPAPVAAPAQPLLQPQAPAASPAPEAVVLPVLPGEGAVVRIVAAGAGVMKATLDGQDSRDYELRPEQKLNWKVGSRLQLELSAPALIRCWVNDQEVPLAEHVAVHLVRVSAVPTPRQ